MGEIRHVAMSVPDPWATAEFYKRLFGFACVGETDSVIAEGVYLSDGVINLALLAFKTEVAAQGRGKDFVGLHHFGVWVDDVEASGKRIEEEGGRWLMGAPDVTGNTFYEVKYHDPNKVIVDLVHNGWAGAERRPGQSDNMVIAPRAMVPRFDERRAKAARDMDARVGGALEGYTPKGALRHFAMSVPDPWATAAFYKNVFGFKTVGETDSSLAEGVFISDGVFEIALLDFKSETASQGLGKDYVGLHHFGIWVEDVLAARAALEKAGGQWLMGEPDFRSGAFYEVKFHDINGVVLDLVHNGWAGTQLAPGHAGNRVCPPQKLVPKFADRRALAGVEA